MKAVTKQSLPALTRREQEVLCELLSGSSNNAGAKRMGLDHRTFSTHRNNLMRKLGVSSLVDLVKVAIRAGLTDL